MSVQQYVYVSLVRDGNGLPTPAASGTMLSADGLGGATWTSGAVSSSLTLAPNPGPGTPPTDNVTIYANLDKLRYINDLGNVFIVATTADLAAYLPLTGGTMLGPISMGGGEITDCSALRVSAPDNNVVIGDTFTTIASSTAVLVGANTSCVNSNSATVVGYNSSATGSSNGVLVGQSGTLLNAPSSIVIGSSSSATAGNVIIVGPGSLSGAANSLIFGRSSVSTATGAHCFGNSITNNTPGSLLFDCTANIRAAATCDLGTSANRFRSLYLNNDLIGSNIFSNTNSVPVWRCSLTNNTVGFSSTTAETNIIQGTLLGSLVIPAPTAAGITFKIFSNWSYSSNAGTTFTIRLKVNGTTVQTHVFTAGNVANLSVQHSMTVQLRTPSNRLYTSSALVSNGLLPSVVNNITDSIWSTVASNTISLTGQFSDTSGVWRGDSFDMWSSHSS